MIRISRNTADIVTALLLMAAAMFLFAETFNLPASRVKGYPGAAFLPRLILIYGMLFIGLWLIMALRAALSPEGKREGFVFEYVDFGVTLLAAVLFVQGLERIGFEITAFVLVAALLLQRTRSIVFSLVASALFVVVIWFTFVILLNVALPLQFLPLFLRF